MNLNEAMMIVRSKFLEEQKGVTSGDAAEAYKLARQHFPVVMEIAHHLLARELFKNMP